MTSHFEVYGDDDRQRIAEAAWVREDETIQAAFERFNVDNPRVYRLLVGFARQLKARGYEHGGIKMLWERMRWEFALERDPLEPFKLSNNYHSRYARRIMEQESDLAGFFRTRELTAE